MKITAAVVQLQGDTIAVFGTGAVGLAVKRLNQS